VLIKPIDDRDIDMRHIVRSWRKKLGFSQVEIARLAEIGQNSLSRYETGERNLSSATLERLERAMDRALKERAALIMQALSER